MPTLQYIPGWTVEYDYSTDPSIVRSIDNGGFRKQSKVGSNRIVIANAQRTLQGSELMYFEWFVRDIINEGSLKFTDSYADHNGLQSGTVRIKDGVYDVTTNKLSHVVSCELEIFR
jgi:hypothetical protein